MKYYTDGDLQKRAPAIRKSKTETERVFLQMIDAIQVLHARDLFHRDIKPQNFLCDGGNIVASDFGLSTEAGSETAFTKSSAFWGTHGYIPPEFLSGGFKHADAAGDIFMLGKTMYVVASGRDPMYLIGDDIDPAIFHVMERCCAIPKQSRYQTLAHLRQSVVSAYDVILNRGGGIGKAKQMLSAIADRLAREQKYSGTDVREFVEQLALLDESDQIKVCFELPRRFFGVISQKSVQVVLEPFLTIYERMVEDQSYSWSYAETIADNMKIVFTSPDAPPTMKAKALDLAISAAAYMNRFAAMGTCIDMITSVKEEPLGMLVANVLEAQRNTFVNGIEPTECRNDSIAKMINSF